MQSVFAFALALMSMSLAASAAPVILDTDLGDDIDDTWALCMVLGSPKFDLRLIVTASGDTEAKTRLVAKILERAGRSNIPLGTGVKTNSETLDQAKWLGDYDLANYTGTVRKDGVTAMIETIHEAKEMVTLLVLGPQTNLKEALARDPGIATKARIVAMAGSVHIGYNGKPGRQPEWNVFRDLPAARAVFDAPWDITIAPLDLCGTLILSGENYARAARSPNPLAQIVMENYRDWKNRNQHPADASSVLFDTAAIYLAMDEALCEMQTLRLSIDKLGNTVPSDDGRPVHCALAWKDRAAFEETLVAALTTKP